MEMEMEIKELLQKNGWIMECETPLEISHVETESFASNVAAEMVIELLRSESRMAKDWWDNLSYEKKEDFFNDYCNRFTRNLSSITDDEILEIYKDNS